MTEIKDSYEFKKYVQFLIPSSSRDLSFAVKNPSTLLFLRTFCLTDYESLKIFTYSIIIIIIKIKKLKLDFDLRFNPALKQ